MSTQQPRLTTISGKVVLKENGIGIPNLHVMIYDLDAVVGIVSNSSPAGKIGSPRKSRRQRGLATSKVQPLLSDEFPPSTTGEKLAQILTSEDGSFSVSIDETDYPTDDPEKKPDIFLMVKGPEDADSNLPPRTLFTNKISYNPHSINSSRTEQFYIRIPSEKLREAGINPPNEDKESPENKIENYKKEKISNFALNEGIANYHGTVVDTRLTEKEEFKTKFKSIIATNIANYKGNGVIVKDGESILPKTRKVFNDGIDNANNKLGGESSPGEPDSGGVPVTLYLTPEDRQNLKTFFDNAVEGIAEIPESFIRPLLFRASGSENIGTLLINNNPVAKYCRDITFEETCATMHLGETPDHDHDEDKKGVNDNIENDGNGNAAGSNVISITSDDIPKYVARLIKDMKSPDYVMNPTKLDSRPNQDAIDESVNQLSFAKGPADVAAYYDFYSLQIAFEYVWKQLFDEEIINSGYSLQTKVSQQTGINPIIKNMLSADNLVALAQMTFNTPLNQMSADISAHFDITREEWNDMDLPLRAKLEEIARTLSNGFKPKLSGGGGSLGVFSLGSFSSRFSVAPGTKVYQELREQGERLIDSARHDDYYTMHKTLRDLHERLNSNYEYTVFAADNNHSSINFGVLNTFRQKWLPLNYQVGKLCKTIPLAPKEERKYSLKITKHIKRNEKDARKNNSSFKNEQTATSRLEGEIIAKALNKTNFNLTAEGTYNAAAYKAEAKTSLGVDAQSESQQTRKDFREAVLKSAQEELTERSTEINTEVSEDSEYNDSGSIVNPNDELAVTYLFYELQRRYRISEQLYRVQPVVLVAQPVPRPHEITEAWVISHDWILNRYLLDDSFAPTLSYLANKSVGDDFALRELRRNLRQQRNLVETLKTEFASASSEAENKYLALLTKIDKRIGEEEREGGEGFFTNVGAFFGHDDADPEAAKARELAAMDEHKYAVEKAEKMGVALRQEVDTLHKLTAEYNKTLRDHLDNETRVKRLLVHFRNNIMYYMQAIWSMEPPDQRFLRMYKIQVPDLKLDDTRQDGGRIYRVEVENTIEDDPFAIFRPEVTSRHKATMSGKLKKPFKFKPLIEVADLVPLGFKGNYMMLPMKEHNALTEFMAAPYIDRAFGAMDPTALENLNLDEFSKYICCLHDTDPDKFEQLKPILNKWFGQLLADPLRNGDELIVPTGSLYIEALPAAHPLLEDFKLRHRELDAIKVMEESRKMKLESVRYAARLLDEEHEDPDIEKKIVVNGNGLSPNIDVDN